MATSEARALPYFSDLYGLPLESGSIYIGQPGLDPVAYPQIVYSDAAQTTVIAQPVRTVHGRAVSAGAQVHLYCQVPYSITVLDSAGRTVYASLNEIDPTLTTQVTTTVQSVSSLTELRARSGASTNQAYVPNFGMYVKNASDNTSPESVPFVIVGNDGTRYYLDLQDGNFGWLRASRPSANPALGAGGGWLSWNDASDGTTWLTNNKGLGVGGFVLRNINADNTAEIGRVAITSTGGINAGAKIKTLSGDIEASGNLIADGGTVAVTSDGARNLHWDPVNQQYVFPSSPVLINNSLAVTVASLVTIMQNQQVGALMNTVGAAPAFPGTWQALATGLGPNDIRLYVRTA
ncbi:hypothetical protein AWB73_00132 [Caballeronia turbans]|nr:hypothetical protein AWB73_00132 [Caballeronia turbans]